MISNHGQSKLNEPTPPRSMSSAKSSASSDVKQEARTTFDLEPNPFEQSFAVKDEKGAAGAAAPIGGATANGQPSPPQSGQAVATPGGRRLLPPVAAITSPSSLAPGQNGNNTNSGDWSSLRSGPLSPAMLQGPRNAQDGQQAPTSQPAPQPQHQQQQQQQQPPQQQQQQNPNSSLSSFVSSLRRTGLSLNESGVRTGLTPGGSGSMFPTPGPATAAILGLTTDPMVNQSQQQQQQQQHQQNIPANAKNPMPPPVAQQPQNQPPQQAQQQAPPQQQQQAHAQQNGQFVPPNPQHAYQTQPQQPAQQQHQPPQTQPQSQAPPAEPPTKKARKESKASNRRNSKSAKEEEANSSIDMDMEDGEEDESMDGESSANTGKKGGRKSKMTEEEKRKSFLERNRIAALKCRQRKKQWLKDLQSKVEFFQVENDQLQTQLGQMRAQMASLKSSLMSHKDCPGFPPEALSLLNSIEYGPSSVGPGGQVMATTGAPIATTGGGQPMAATTAANSVSTSGGPMMVPIVSSSVESTNAALAPHQQQQPGGMPQPAASQHPPHMWPHPQPQPQSQPQPQ